MSMGPKHPRGHGSIAKLTKPLPPYVLEEGTLPVSLHSGHLSCVQSGQLCFGSFAVGYGLGLLLVIAFLPIFRSSRLRLCSGHIRGARNGGPTVFSTRRRRPHTREGSHPYADDRLGSTEYEPSLRPGHARIRSPCDNLYL